LIRYWLTPAPDERFDEKVDDINSLYQQAQNLAQKGEIVMSIDEMTGVQLLKGKAQVCQWHQEKWNDESLSISGMELNHSLLALRWPVEGLTPFLAAIRAMKKTLYRISRRWLKALLPHHSGTLSPTTSISINQSPS
jgi:hypothetical protein